MQYGLCKDFDALSFGCCFSSAFNLKILAKASVTLTGCRAIKKQKNIRHARERLTCGNVRHKLPCSYPYINLQVQAELLIFFYDLSVATPKLLGQELPKVEPIYFIVSSTAPSNTLSPGFTQMPVTSPSCSAAMLFSIFMASKTRTASPRFTC